MGDDQQTEIMAVNVLICWTIGDFRFLVSSFRICTGYIFDGFDRFFRGKMEMTENKMQDVIWLGWNSGWNCAEHKIDGCGTKYYRAEPVEAMLKQARDVVAIHNDEYSGYDDLITAIDVFLGDGK